MNATKLEAEVEAAFVIEKAGSPSLRALITLYGEEAVRSCWTLGWCVGRQSGLEAARTIMGMNLSQ